jgi:DNA-binding LacI/PurR family transcriptional regulator
MSVVAFDDLPPAITFDPFFTVAAQSAYEMGVRATDLLLQRLAGTGPAEPQEIVLPIEFIVRRSSGPPPDVPQGAANDGRRETGPGRATNWKGAP